MIKINERGIMLSDYFNGTPGVMLPIYITPKTVRRELVEMIRQEINMVWDYIACTFPDEDDLEANIDQEIGIIEAYILENEPDRLVCPDMEYTEEEDGENPILILTIEEEEW